MHLLVWLKSVEKSVCRRRHWRTRQRRCNTCLYTHTLEGPAARRVYLETCNFVDTWFPSAHEWRLIMGELFTRSIRRACKDVPIHEWSNIDATRVFTQTRVVYEYTFSGSFSWGIECLIVQLAFWSFYTSLYWLCYKLTFSEKSIVIGLFATFECFKADLKCFRARIYEWM